MNKQKRERRQKKNNKKTQQKKLKELKKQKSSANPNIQLQSLWTFQHAYQVPRYELRGVSIYSTAWTLSSRLVDIINIKYMEGYNHGA